MSQAIKESLLISIPLSENRPCLVLAHGAGAPMDSPFMERMTDLLSERGICVVRFEFPYMALRRTGGGRRPPNRQPELLGHWRAVIQCLAPTEKLIIGGKSMGGRMASLIADEEAVAGLVCLGYPFHPQGKPEKTRTAHLEDLNIPTLILQGNRDSLGNYDDVAGYQLSSSIEVQWLDDGDHDLKPRVKSGFTHEQNLIKAADAIASFVDGLSKGD